MSRTYTVEVQRGDDRWWTLICPEISLFTQCRTTDGIAAEVVPIIAEVEGIPESDIELDIQYKLPAEYLSEIERAHEAAARAEEASRTATEATRNAAKALLAAGITMRDAGRLMGLSHQRISQITAG